MLVDERGYISRPEINMPASGQWKIIGAIEFNNLGNPVREYTLSQVLTEKICWKHKNGKQKTHIIDLDHGTQRIWMNPPHNLS